MKMGRIDGRSTLDCPRDAGDGAGFVFAREGVLPNTKHAPAPDLEEPVHLAVALLVARDLGIPELAIGFRATVVDRAAVPVTTINKNSEAMRGKHEVGFAGEFEIASPASDAVRAEN